MPKLLHRLKNWIKTRGKSTNGKTLYKNKNTGTVRTNKGTKHVPNNSNYVPNMNYHI